MAQNNKNHGSAAIRVDGGTIRCAGDWIVAGLHPLESRIARLEWPRADTLVFDLSGLGRVDTAGAWLLHRTLEERRRAGAEVRIEGQSAQTRSLLELVGSARVPREPVRPERRGFLERLGRATSERVQEDVDFVAFVGESAVTALPVVLNPLRFRWKQVVVELAEAGHRAMPIVGLLAFLLGVVIAYQGGVQLRLYGANLFIADLVGLSMLRELAPLITAIIVAGRTGSAYTAQIGTMKVTEEVDALRTMGVSPIELLTLPKLLGLLIALPLLTVYADIMGVLGGMIMSATMLGISPITFLDRLNYAVTLQSYMIGVGKAPVFAAIIALVGCFQGFRVSGSAESVGRRTTVSVVQSILLVIVVDAAFSVAFSWLGI
jgi:phospholipid/cholesterol/gamma-HCH transport system permease protein